MKPGLSLGRADCNKASKPDQVITDTQRPALSSGDGFSDHTPLRAARLGHLRHVGEVPNRGGRNFYFTHFYCVFSAGDFGAGRMS